MSVSAGSLSSDNLDLSSMNFASLA
jgi:hypothetical protein